MDVRLIPYKIKQRLNKKDSSDYDNLECHTLVEAYNKAQLERCRTQLKEGAENTIRRVDDLQILLTPVEILGSNRDYYFLSNPIPKDYLSYSLLRVWGSNDSCKKESIKSTLREEANADDLYKDLNHKPSFKWRSTFHTIVGDRIKIYRTPDFVIDKIELTYYREPREIRIVGCDYLGTPSPENVDPELNKSLVELIIDEAAAIIAADIENMNQAQILKNRADINN